MGVHDLASKDAFTKAVVDGVSPADDAHKGQVVLLDCFATWCGPCKAIAPTIAEWSNDDKYKDKVAFYKFDVDELPDLAAELGVRAMPTFFIFKSGETEPAAEFVGADPRGLAAKLDAVLAEL